MKLEMDEQATRRQHFFLHRVTELAQRAEEALPGISESVLPVVRRAVFQQPQEMPRWSGRQPVVGILTRTARDHRYLPENEEIKYQGVSEDILEAVEQAGGVAEVIPVTNPLDYTLWKVGQCDVLIAPGTQEADIDPALYGEPNTYSGNTLPERNLAEMIALLYAILVLGLPTLTICVGFQALVVALGGKVYQDLNKQRPGTMNHSCWGVGLARTAHSIRIEAESWLSRHTGFQKRVEMNSLHHQGTDKGKVPEDLLKLVAFAPDGVAEAGELQHSWRVDMGLPDDEIMPVIGIQGHPEVKSGAALYQVIPAVIKAASGS